MIRPAHAVPALCGAYALLATGTALHAHLTVGADAGASFLSLLADHELAILPWIPASMLIAVRVRRAAALGSLPVARRALALVPFGIAVVGVVNLAQAGLLTSLGSWRGAWLDTFALGVVETGHLGLLWYALVALIALAFYARYGPAAPPAPARANATWADTLEVGDGPARRLLRVSEIVWIEARGDYVRLHTTRGSYLQLGRMKRLEGALDPERFARVHRSAIVNLARVRSFRHVQRGDYELELDQGQRLRLARSRRADVLRRLRGS